MTWRAYLYNHGWNYIPWFNFIHTKL